MLTKGKNEPSADSFWEHKTDKKYRMHRTELDIVCALLCGGWISNHNPPSLNLS